MKRYALIILGLSMAAFVFGEESALLKDFTGKVEIKMAGQDWVAAEMNMKLPLGAEISTGFKSYATIQAGASTLQVKPLTRVSVSELTVNGGKQKTTVDLKVGRVRAKVEKVQGLEQDFTLKSPVSTAAVRGTEFEFDSVRLQVFEGIVRFANAFNQGRSIHQGESSEIRGNSAPAGAEAGLLAQSQTEISTRPLGATETGPQTLAPTTGTLKVSIGALQ